MTDAEFGSRSDLEALRRSGRGKVVVLLVLLVAALGAAGWFFFLRKQGTGNPEDPAKVLVVARTRGYSIVLTDAGFEAAEGTFEAWELKAKEEVPNLEVAGIEAIMTLADRFGYGYVVFEKPRDVDFSALDIEGGTPELPEHVRFAVLSAGDFAFPHVMTVNPKPSDVLRGSSVVILQALFLQERLAETLPDAESPSIGAIQLRDRLGEGLERLAQIPEAEQMAEKIVHQVRRQLEEEERAERKAGLVGQPLESGSPFVLANGQVLSVSRGFKVVTRDAVRADLDLDDTERLWAGAPGVDAEARVPCSAIHEGAMSVHESPRYWMSDDGAALLIHSLSDGLVLWTLDASQAGAASGCAFTSKGTVSAPGPGLGEAVPAGHGQIARVGTVGRQGVVSVVTAGQSDELMLGMLDWVELQQVAWLSDHHLVAVGQGNDGPGLYFFDTQTPMTVLHLPANVFENAEALHEVAVGKRGERPVVVVTAGYSPRRLYRLDLPQDLSSLFASPPVDAAEPTPPDVDAGEPDEQDELDALDELDPLDTPTEDRAARGLPSIVRLDPNRFVATALTTEGAVRAPSVAADGSFVAFELRGDQFDPTEPDDSEIAAVATTGGALRLLTRNALKDHDPRITPNGSHVLFKTRVEIPKTDWVISSPRVVALGGG
ncbi:TolB family protein [Paraliomyxa miuraensis]|uniref:TolB family protein n=1 Tax=Paraliomyxa miuraensis TaxID=376150 RepID=UPI00224FC63B|nr:hypothetical protein [Paraliomyxa miuraensis]MCX4243287.1 hypothetical protein [Paraliomyxa miuraensis]